MGVVDLLDRPVYGMGQVDRLLGLASGTARRWIDGYWRSDHFYQPIVRPQTTGSPVVTWGEFVETRLLSEYREAGVRINKLRAAVTELREHFGDYPLARSAPFVETHGQRLVLQVQDALGLDDDLQLVLLGSRGQLMLSPKAQDFVDAVQYDHGQAARLVPDRDVPAVVIDPLRASGEPVIRAVPTEVLAELAKAGDSPEWIAELYDLDVDQVEDAIRFEQRRRRGTLTTDVDPRPHHWHEGGLAESGEVGLGRDPAVQLLTEFRVMEIRQVRNRCVDQILGLAGGAHRFQVVGVEPTGCLRLFEGEGQCVEAGPHDLLGCRQDAGEFLRMSLVAKC